MASRMRCIMCHAVRQHTPYFRSTSRAAIPFFDAHISKITRIQMRNGAFVPWNTVPVIAENCLRQPWQRHTRRSLIAPVRVFRDTPFAGAM